MNSDVKINEKKKMFWQLGKSLLTPKSLSNNL